MCTVLLPPGDNPIAVNIYIISISILDKLLEYKRNWIQHVNRMPRNRLPRVMKHCSSTGRRNYGRPLKRLLDMWDRNGSTSGPTPWQIYDDDDDFYGVTWKFWNWQHSEIRYCVSVTCNLLTLCNGLCYITLVKHWRIFESINIIPWFSDQCVMSAIFVCSLLSS